MDFDNGTGLRPYIQGYIQSSISRNEWGIELSVKGKGTRRSLIIPYFKGIYMVKGNG